MREIMKKTVAAVMAVLIACAAAGCSSTGNSSSGSSSAGETTTTTAPIVEDMGNIDLSDVTTEYDVPEDFSYESEGTSSNNRYLTRAQQATYSSHKYGDFPHNQGYP